jgi:hypothetical protein
MESAVPAIDQEYEPEPVFSVLAESGPTYGPAQAHRIAFQACFLADFPPQPANHVFIAVKLAAQAIVLAEVKVFRAAIAMDQQDLPTIR